MSYKTEITTRTPLLSILLVCVFLATTASMCDDSDDSSLDKGQVQNSLQDGAWHVTYFFDKVDETSDFSGYTFTFNDNGTAEATKNSATTSGTWSTDNSSNGTVKLVLDFGVSSPLDELSEDWRILEFTDTRIKLEHVSGGNGDTDSLILER